MKEAYGYLNESIDILKNKSSVAVVATFFNVSSVPLYQVGHLTETELIENYALVSDIIDFQLEKRPDNESLLRVKEATDGNFINSGAPTCSSLVGYFQPMFAKRKDDVAYRRAVHSL